MKGCPTVDDIVNVIDTVELAIEQKWGRKVVTTDPNDLSKAHLDQLALTMVTLIFPVVMHKIDFTKGA